MSTQTMEKTNETVTRQVGFGSVMRAEWVKLWTVRSTWWTVLALVVLGAGLTTLICWGNAEWLAGPESERGA